MREALLKITEIEMLNFEPSGFTGKFALTFTLNEERQHRKLVLDFNKRSDALTQQVISMVKSSVQFELDEDDLVGSLFVKRLVNEEKVEEKLLNFFSHICENVKMLKTQRKHDSYMKLYHELNGKKISF